MARQLTGRVASDKADKTIVIRVASRKTHRIYKKQYTRNAKFMAHDERNEAKTGDLVVITETRPRSAKKRFILERVIEKAHAGFVETDATADVVQDQNAQDTAQKTEGKPKRVAKSKKEVGVTGKKVEV